tara:strand:+ start:1181 stop:2065 length:885 start_codon:yes stop_codon:yes gene_type:complete
MVNNKKKNKHKLKKRKPDIELKTVAYSVDDTSKVTLELPFIEDANLPYVSIITPTKNKGKLFRLAVHQFLNFNYPRDKLEWIILDNGTERVKKYLDFKDESNLIYMTLDPTKRYPIGELRNVCIEKSSYDIIVYMDDDDYYPPESILSRVKSLLKYFHLGIECVGCQRCLSYNINDKSCFWYTNGKLNFLEASMCHTKRFWNKRKYKSDLYMECESFLKDRHNEIINIPFQFVMIIINHKGNYTNRGNNQMDKLVNIDYKIGNVGDDEIMVKNNTFIDKIFSQEIKEIIYDTEL